VVLQCTVAEFEKLNTDRIWRQSTGAGGIRLSNL
jgi:hypothetical protein